ncbi:class I SAM-dependent methyltransferase [Kribbella sp. VKM Ac-2568]|uniref:class I SAM-dependent methyltransferase n=1 Tax=Kribbella sp. VKM Ac-2568 TaxID=2512219 RepID=UPI00104C43D4
MLLTYRAAHGRDHPHHNRGQPRQLEHHRSLPPRPAGRVLQLRRRRPRGLRAGTGRRCPRQRILQLACSCGDQVLSWTNLGAIATGIDISDVAIQVARRKASDAGIEADFRQADIFDLPADLVNLDLIYLS